MSAGKVLLLGGVGLGLAFGLVAIASASSKSSSAAAGGGVPPGWAPPKGAAVQDFPTTMVGKAMRVAQWQAAPGQPPGHYQLFWAPSDPKTFLALFWPDGQHVPAVMDVGTTPESITLQQALPQLIASTQAAQGAA